MQLRPIFTRLLVIVLLLLVSGVGCGDDVPPFDPAGQTEVVIGLTTGFIIPKELDRLDITMQVNGETVSQESLTLGSGAGTTQFPAEIAFKNVAVGADLLLTMRGFNGDFLTVVRTVKTQVEFADKRLIRIPLEASCSLDMPVDGPGSPAPTCNELSHTCITGKCQNASVGPTKHEPYTSDWPSTGDDPCKPADSGAAEVIVGEGQSDFFPNEDYDVAQVEAGPQGGHHIWVAARVKNLLQSGSITQVGGEIPDLGLSISPLVVIFTLGADEDDYCKISGLRFQIDIGGEDIQTLLGQTMKVIVSVEDQSGDVGTGERWVTLSTDTI